MRKWNQKKTETEKHGGESRTVGRAGGKATVKTKQQTNNNNNNNNNNNKNPHPKKKTEATMSLRQEFNKVEMKTAYQSVSTADRQ